MDDLISRNALIYAFEKRTNVHWQRLKILCPILDEVDKAERSVNCLRLSNREWIDFLVYQFDVSHTSAKEMLHVLMRIKAEDNFKKQFSGGANGKSLH